MLRLIMWKKNIKQQNKTLQFLNASVPKKAIVSKNVLTIPRNMEQATVYRIITGVQQPILVI